MNNVNNRIGIVTVLYNSETVLEEFFRTLKIQTFGNFTLYIVDNKSPDGSLAMSRRLAEEVFFETVVIANDDNYGVAKGNNIGIKRALEDGCELILLSNNDTVLESDTIELLVKGMEAHAADMAVPKIYYHGSDTIWAAGGRFTWYNGSTRHYGAGMKDSGGFDKIRYVDYSPTCFLLIKKEVFGRVGFMDENYFVYYDDTDFLWRCRENSIKLIYIPDSVLHHKESTSTGGQAGDFTVYYMERNRIYFSEKNLGRLQRTVVRFYTMLHNTFRKPFVWNKRQIGMARRAQRDGRELLKLRCNGIQ
ncbi:MAG: glycosyltransferase family 2 protein [Rikenellaceae bacterium]|nr:glycosyltransferase family 2 protein [Rikenellaceae bacterium]